MTIIIPQTEPRRFDDACRSAQAGDTILLEEGGVYETAGCWAADGFQSLRPGVTLEASGATVRLVSPERATHGVERPDRDLILLTCGPGARIIGGTFDGNWQQQEEWFVSGIRFHGRFEVRGATIKGLAGSRSSGTPSGAVEVFAISAEGKTGGSIVQDVTVRDCRVDSPSDYVSGIYVGATEASDAWSKVERCNVQLGEHGQFAYASNGKVVFHGCTGNAARYWYNDTGDTDDCRIQSGLGTCSYAVVSAVAKDAQGNRRIAIRGGEFTAPRLCEWWDQSPGFHLRGHVICSSVRWRGDFSFAVAAAANGALAAIDCDLGEHRVIRSNTDIEPILLESAPTP